MPAGVGGQALHGIVAVVVHAERCGGTDTGAPIVGRVSVVVRGHNTSVQVMYT